ncbi:MAG: bifunctional DNA-formamidopyrimidine glycosylase/DNA-(apurinic or apyrimidinic site) lyase [Planctomycetota bacterium]
MPELPEVETMRRGIVGCRGGRIVDVTKLRCSRKPIEISPMPAQFRRRVRGATVTELTRAGKRVVLWLDTDEAIVIEPRMTGLVLVVDPPTNEHLRWQLKLEGADVDQVFYWDRRGLGNVRLFSRTEYEIRFGLENLGPDGLEISAEQYRSRLGTSRREIKPALLDQRAVAGIGNIYASEILHVAGIHPARRCNAMTRRQWQALASATHAVLEDAVRYEGSTLGDGTYRNALNEAGEYQNEHRVYARVDQPCPRCDGATIQRIVQTQRSTFFCSSCQRRAGAIFA